LHPVSGENIPPDRPIQLLPTNQTPIKNGSPYSIQKNPIQTHPKMPKMLGDPTCATAESTLPALPP
uniref:Uncharacterized protein n=1 Tax=Oryza brachyantha TaxID=4533 RepID=J3L6B7_ORYBR